MSTSPLSPEDIRAAAEVHRELGPEYSDAVVASFLDKVDREIAARVEARLAGISRPRRQRRFTLQALAGRDSRRALLKGVAIGVCAGGALASAVAIGAAGSPAGGSQLPAHAKVFRGVPMPGKQWTIVGPKGKVVVVKPPPPPPPPPPGN
jgi:hypothetical protein